MVYHKTVMKCPIHKDKDLKTAIFYNTEIDYCPQGLGVWFEKGEFRIAKDGKQKNLDWLDVDLWKEKTKFQISEEEKQCPACEVPMYELSYNDSDIKVDICNVCEGVWLDRGEFKKIIGYLREKSSKKVMNEYVNSLLEETAEVFSGPESLEDEVSDVITVAGLLSHKLSAKFPTLADIISDLPRS